MPKFGNMQAAEVWAATARTLTDISAEEIFDLPEYDSIYPCAEPVSSGTADTYGSWVQISADIGAGKRLIGMIVTCQGGLSVGEIAEVEIGEGASESESAVARGFYTSNVTFNLLATLFLPLYRSLSDNIRLAVRVRDDDAAANTYTVVVLVV